MSQEIPPAITSADVSFTKGLLITLLDKNSTANVRYIREQGLGFLAGYSILDNDVELPAQDWDQIAGLPRARIQEELERVVWGDAEPTIEEKTRFMQLLGRCEGAIWYTSLNNPNLSSAEQRHGTSVQGLLFLMRIMSSPSYTSARIHMEISRTAFIIERGRAVFESRMTASMPDGTRNADQQSVFQQSSSANRPGSPTPSNPSAATMTSIRPSTPARSLAPGGSLRTRFEELGTRIREGRLSQRLRSLRHGLSRSAGQRRDASLDNGSQQQTSTAGNSDTTGPVNSEGTGAPTSVAASQRPAGAPADSVYLSGASNQFPPSE